MKVILVKDTANLGSMGDEIEVKDGYARNYLIPKEIAIPSTKSALRILEDKKREKERIEKKIIEEYRGVAAKLKDVSCTISVEAGEEDKLFGAVTSEDIAETLKSEGMEIDKKKIALDEPIKALGVYNIDVKLHPEVKAQIRVWVVKK